MSVIRAETTNRVSSQQSIQLRESLLNEIETLRSIYGPYEADKMMGLVMDGLEPTVQLFGGATLTEFIGSDT